MNIIHLSTIALLLLLSISCADNDGYNELKRLAETERISNASKSTKHYSNPKQLIEDLWKMRFIGTPVQKRFASDEMLAIIKQDFLHMTSINNSSTEYLNQHLRSIVQSKSDTEMYLVALILLRQSSDYSAQQWLNDSQQPSLEEAIVLLQKRQKE